MVQWQHYLQTWLACARFGNSQMTLGHCTLQGHEEFDDEITLAGSGRIAPQGEGLLNQCSPEETAALSLHTQQAHEETHPGHWCALWHLCNIGFVKPCR